MDGKSYVRFFFPQKVTVLLMVQIITRINPG